jgi:hypothetical protein
MVYSKRIDNLHTGLGVYVESKDLEITSAGAILRKFNEDIDSKEPITAKPLGCVLNPEVGNKRIFPYEDVWLFLYRQGFRVHVIKHHRYVSGPHACRLYYRSWQTHQLFWIATLQIDGAMFYSEEAVQMHLTLAILDHQFYIAPKSEKLLIAK